MDLFRRSEDLSKISSDVIQNNYVLCFVSMLAGGNFIQFVYSGDVMSMVIFIASGLLTSFFSPSLTVILIIAIVISNVCIIGTNVEGFKKKKGGFKKKKKKAKKEVEEAVEEEATGGGGGGGGGGDPANIDLEDVCVTKAIKLLNDARLTTNSSGPSTTGTGETGESGE